MKMVLFQSVNATRWSHIVQMSEVVYLLSFNTLLKNVLNQPKDGLLV